MKVIITLEHRFDRTPDGRVWTQTTFPYSFWQRYLKVFDRVCVVARIRDVPSVDSDWQVASGDMVSFAAIPNYLGPVQYLRKAALVKQVVRAAVGPNDAIIMRVPSQISSDLQQYLKRNNHPYAIEVVADPYDVFAPGSIEHPLRPLFQWLFPRTLRRICANAAAAVYVTKLALQQRYPCANFSVGISDVVLPKERIVDRPRPIRQDLDLVKLVYVGTMSQMYKAPDILIKAVAACIKAGLNLHLVLLGDGQYRPQLEDLAAAQDVGDRIKLLGQLASGDAVQAQLDRSDLFILASYQEGLPRAMVEAMARGLPCLGSNVGGVPELLPPEDLVEPGDIDALAQKIREMVTDPERMARMSARNLAKAREYQDDVLQQQRTDFYQYVRDRTEAWIASKK
jgi:L-malate glycosyltransferase